MREVWASIAEFPTYLVSNFGKVKNADTGKILRPNRTVNGYIQYYLFEDKRRYRRFAHRLVAEAFLGDITGLEIDHLDDNKINNCVSNLEIVTHTVNNQRAYDRGRIPSSMIAVRIVETGEEFRSISECARVLNRSQQSVWYALRNGTSTAGIHLEEVIS